MKQYKKVILQLIKDTMKQREVFHFFDYNTNTSIEHLNTRIETCKEFLHDMSMFPESKFRIELWERSKFYDEEINDEKVNTFRMLYKKFFGEYSV